MKEDFGIFLLTLPLGAVVVGGLSSPECLLIQQLRLLFLVAKLSHPDNQSQVIFYFVVMADF